MPGVYTQSRKLDFNPVWYAGDRPLGTTKRVDSHRTTLPPIPGSQTTTSYRSGALGDLLELEAPDTRIYGPPTASSSGLNSSRDTGHGFYSRSQRFVRTSHPDFSWSTTRPVIGGYERYWRGPIVLNLSPWLSDVYPTVQPLSPLTRTREMDRLWSMALPTRSEGDVTTALAEIFREGLPSLVAGILTRTANLRKAGGDYLNVEFGWKPLVADVTSTISTLKKASAIIHQYSRDSGRYVRRRVGLPPIPSTNTVTAQPYSVNWGPSLNNLGWVRDGDVNITQSFETRWWFSGQFTYYLPTDDSVLGKLREYESLGNKLLGTRLTPDVLWNLAPWSWLVDWVSTVGSSLSNVVAFQTDGLVMRYGYMMRRTRVTTVASCTLRDQYTGTKLQVRNTFEVDQKERMQGTPYGFGLDPAVFDPRKWAILAALGLTLAPRRL